MTKMDQTLFPNKESYHAFITLGNIDDNFIALPSGSNAVLYYTGGNNDLALVSRGELYNAIDQISRIPGLISSRTLILFKNSHHKERTARKHSGLLLLESMCGQEENLRNSLSQLEEAYSVYEARGIYNTLALVSFDDEKEFKTKVNSLPHIKYAALNPSEKPIEPVEVVAENQLITAKHYDTRNKYEIDYQPNEQVNADYAQGCIAMAKKMLEIEERQGPISMIYAPLRGAKPIVDAMLEAYRRLQKGERDVFSPNIQFPVTSSFVSYPLCHPYLSKKGRKPAFGRANNLNELQRLRKRKKTCDLAAILYVDEIVSGGMLLGHAKEIFYPFGSDNKKGEFYGLIESGECFLNVFGLAHAHGKKFGTNKQKIFRKIENWGGLKLHEFPIENLITEDQRFLLGAHYLLNHFGPHLIPFIDEKREYLPAHRQFWQGVKKTIEDCLP